MSFTADTIVDALRLFAGRERKGVFGPFVNELTSNPQSFDWLHARLEDDESRRVLEWAIRFRVVTYLAQDRQIGRELAPSRISERRWADMVARSKLLDEARYEKNIEVDLVENFILDGYNLPGICDVAAGDTVLDLGGFNGNSAIALARHCPQGMVHVFEPNPVLQEVLLRNVATSGLANIRLVRAGVGDQVAKLRLTRDGAASRVDPAGEFEVDITTIDAWLRANAVESVDFLKFDIEGYEQQALSGARNTIRTCRPKMAVSIYHMFNDFVRIPRLIADLGWYRFHLRHNAITGGEIVLFCSPA